MRAHDLMTAQPLTVVPQDSLAVAAERMWAGDCGCLPVLNDDGVVVAMITDRDICMAAWLRHHPPHELRVQQAMSKSVVTCRSEDALEDVESTMRLAQVRRLPVVDDGRLVGIISLADIALSHERAGRYPGANESNGLSSTLASICERPVLRASPNGEAATEEPETAAAE